ncbi:protein arginine kinase [Clostridium pascui]|uniref:protein arginine kinase n=1 Tax=Clostridium pascui TaxID=46609 RepID=UPI00195BD714|nr:protein arginine kinase [Clostridium pascui]MBM7869570.1 protein arginine kinase [Clostridium pascui]
MQNWIHSSYNEDGIILSSRIRLARNLKDKSFPHKLFEEQGREIVKEVEEVLYDNVNKDDFTTIYLWQTNSVDDGIYLEKHFISDRLISNKNKAAFIINDEETISVMINEEDHLRIQCITSGYNLDEAYKAANDLDDKLEGRLQYAYDEELGYLTACPTNVGTALRASVMIHLPALTMNNEVSKIFNALNQVGITVRGLYGEGSKAEGNLYQVSNQVTLGLTEQEIINNLKLVVNQLISEEKRAREMLLNTHLIQLEDKVYRSLGVLKFSRLLNGDECLKLLSYVRLGLEMGIIKDVDKNTLNELLLISQRSMLDKIASKELSYSERDILRAKIVRDKLK